MSFFSKFFGLDENQKNELKATINSEINIFECITAHMKWKGRLESYLEGTSQEVIDAKIVCLDNQCTLGKWIHGPALNYFHDDEGFKKLRLDHAAFHTIAGDIVTKVQANDKTGANMIFKNEYAHASRDVIHDLTELNKIINNNPA